jgi:hypothetical protein
MSEKIAGGFDGGAVKRVMGWNTHLTARVMEVLGDRALVIERDSHSNLAEQLWADTI